MKLSRHILSLLIITTLTAVLGGCSTTPTKHATAELTVPWAGSYAVASNTVPLAFAETTGSKLLADGDIVIPRGEKYATGDLQISGVSAYSTYTYEAEPIGLPGGSGYRYRAVVRTGISVP